MNQPVTLRFDDRVYFDARQALTLATRVDALHCIALTRRLISEFLLRVNAEDALVRLAKGDVAETVLARRAMEVAGHESYLACQSVREREDVLELTLAETLVAWLQARSTCEVQQYQLACALSGYFEFRTGRR